MSEPQRADDDTDSIHDVDARPAKKRRTKTFTGCWTCKRRKIKCDEGHPNCSNCGKAGLECEGYGMRLTWTSVRAPSTFSATGDRADEEPVSAGPLPGQGSEATTMPGSPNTRESLPGVAQAHPLLGGVDTPEPVTLQPRSDALHASTRDPHGGSYGRVLVSDLIATPVSTPGLQVPLCSQPRPPALSVPDPSRSSDFLSNTEGVYQDVGWLPRSNPVRSQQETDTRLPGPHAPTGTRHLDLLPDLALQSQLMEHWSTHLCDSLNPLPGMNNPLRTTITPIALEGARTASHISTGSTALFHFICSASAFNLSQTRGSLPSKRALENAALEHHSRGITHLRKNIESNDHAQSVAILASLVMCIYSEAVSGPTPYWRLHMRGAVKWLKHIDYQVWYQSESASLIYQMFICVTTFIQSQFLLVERDESLWDLSYDPTAQPEPYMLDTAFGMPQSLLLALSSMNRIHVQRICSERTAAQDEQITRDIYRLEIELFMSMPTRPPSATVKSGGELMYHHGATYYFAALIYLKRVLKNVHIEEVQTLIEQSLDHLEAMETTTNRPFSPFIWPITIIGCDAHDSLLQRRMIKCLEAFGRGSGMDMWAQLARLMRDLWELRRTEGNADLKWYETSVFTSNQSFMMI
ncbi:Transcriptional activator protein UGA3 [Sphaceloma murrayae]|uniref:Transcriptional activator protein UGA3 n=1 Tax=Sphaceloma murrayae TaxID=2082308 RepID=A0A2K1QXE8_9PEZI|nr:Transcriptional activator protein UGA3 [Sphaceloma murrayae]